MIKRLNTFLNKKHKIAFFIVFISMFLTASLEMLGIGVLTSIVIFLKDPDNFNSLIQKHEILSFINFEIINFNQIFIAVIIFFCKRCNNFNIKLFDINLQKSKYN